jgi:ATP-dependent Lhr-like helicase
VLERIHRRTLSRLREEVEPCADDEFAAFRLEWQHLGGEGLEAGAEGVETVLEQLTGLALPIGFWEKAVLPARVTDYRPEHLDLLCMSGEYGWRAMPPENCDAAQPFPARISFEARRGRAYPSKAAHTEERDRVVLDILGAKGARYLDEIAESANLSERDALAALWRLTAAGRVSNDSFAPLRLLIGEPEAAHATLGSKNLRSVTHQDAAVRARLKSSLSGRWSATRITDGNDEEERLIDETGLRDRMRDIAAILLNRHGILSREMLGMESMEISWRDLSFALRRMEYAGLIRRGWFVRALSGEQYALPEALEILSKIRSGKREHQITALSAADPANPYGVLLPGCGVTRDPENLMVLRGGRVILGLSGRKLDVPAPLDSDSMKAAMAVLMRLRAILRIETIGESAALESDWVSLFAAMRFHSDGQSLVYDGLPGPVPARALSASARA